MSQARQARGFTRRGGAPDIVRFAGVRLPSTDFNAVNNGLLIQAEFVEFDLSVARSISAGTQLEVAFEGNVIYADQNTDVGNCTIIFQDSAKSLGHPARLFVQPGSNFQLPFTRFMLENAAQAGKVMRLFYGVDIEFKPGNTNNVQVSGTVNVAEQGLAYGAAYSSNALIAAGGTSQVFAPASNVNGALLHSVTGLTAAAGTNTVVLLAKSGAAPATSVDGDPLSVAAALAAGGIGVYSDVPKLQRIPAGKGLWFFSGLLETSAVRGVLYTLL